MNLEGFPPKLKADSPNSLKKSNVTSSKPYTYKHNTVSRKESGLVRRKKKCQVAGLGLSSWHITSSTSK